MDEITFKLTTYVSMCIKKIKKTEYNNTANSSLNVICIISHFLFMSPAPSSVTICCQQNYFSNFWRLTL